MTGGPTFEFKVQFAQRQKGRKSKEKPTPPRIPRIAKTMALAIHLQGMIRDGLAKDQADLARLGGVTRARLTQIMNLLCLSPGIQEEILFLPRVNANCDHLVLNSLLGIARNMKWELQMRQWERLCS